MRHKIDQRAQPQYTQQQLEDANQKGQREHQRHILGAARRRQRTHGGEHHNRYRRGGPGHQMPGGAPQRRHNRRQHGRIQTVLGGMPAMVANATPWGTRIRAPVSPAIKSARRVWRFTRGHQRMKGSMDFKTTPRRPGLLAQHRIQKSIGTTVVPNQHDIWPHEWRQLALLVGGRNTQTPD